MKLKIIGLALIFLLLIMIFPVSAQDSNFTPMDCPFGNPTGYDYSCGMVTVPENHLVDNGETIQLAVAIIHSENPNPEADPVLYLAGGPGAENVITASQMPLQFNFNTILVNRDVIIVDQRGMGLSQPNFNCVPFTGINDAFNLDIEAYQARMADCIPEFEAEGIDWQVYTTEQNAADLALIPGLLGYETYNIFGQSYGTVLAQVMLRDYPENIRSAVLDSVIPISVNSFEQAPLNDAHLFSIVEADCQADLACRLAYPNLRETYFDTYFRLTDNPVILHVDGSDFPVTGRMFADFVHINMTSRAGIANLPALITAFAENDLDIVIGFLEGIIARPVEDYPNQALLMTMICPGVAPYTSVEQIIAVHSTVEEPFRKASFNEITWLMCQSWEGVPPANRTLPDSDIPTLLLAGDYDVLAPPYWAEEVAGSLSNASFISLPYTGHLTNSSGCAQGLIVNFFNDPSQTVDSACTDDIKPVGFILHATVTRTAIRVGAIILSIVAIFAVGQVLLVGSSDLRRTAWKMAFKRQGWLPLISLTVMILLVLTNATVLPDDLVTVGVVQSILPLLMALQAAAVFSPADEPALEVQMSASRSILWLVVERLLAVIITYTVIAVIGIALTLFMNSEQNTPILLFGWLPPALFMSGLATYLTIRSRLVALGVIAIGFLWFMFGLFAPFFIPGQAFPPPINLIQPFMWSFHVHASLEDLALADFWLNRFFLTGAGISLMFGAVRELLDTEKLLLGVRSKKPGNIKKSEKSVIPNLKPSLTVEAVAIRIVPLRQMMGIAKYTFIMRWRSRALKVFALTPIAVICIFMLALGDLNFIPGMDALPNLSLEQRMVVVGEMATAISIAIFSVPAIFMYPILVADTIPADENLHVSELLNANPVSYPVTLAGRILGTVIAGAVVMIFTLSLTAGAVFLRHGQFSLSPFIDMAIGMILAMSILSAISLLLGATQLSARRAIAFVTAFLILPEMLQSVDIIRQLFPSRAGFFTMYIEASFGNMITQPVTTRTWQLFEPETLQLLGNSFMTMLIAGIAVVAWHHYRQSSD